LDLDTILEVVDWSIIMDVIKGGLQPPLGSNKIKHLVRPSTRKRERKKDIHEDE
jgi:hypothetical protein